MARETDRPSPLSPSEIDYLRWIARAMIPPGDEFGAPGADDPAIMSDMVRSLGRDRNELRRVLAVVRDALGGSSAAAPSPEHAALLVGLRRADPAGFSVVEAVVSRAYYRDDRVLISIGMEPRPPFPQGYDVEQADWSLLDPVRRRGVMYRDADV